jgi:hypothetical protein
VTTHVPRHRRAAISIGLALLAGFRAWHSSVADAVPRDFAQVWFAARAFLGGRDPYALIGHGLAFEWRWPFYYPLTAAVAAVPLAPLPVIWAGVVFAAIAGGCFAWALMEHGYAPLLGFMSTAMLLAAEVVQWSPLMAAALVIPPLSVLAAAKPTIGAALFIARPSRWALVGGVVLCVIAFAGQPFWVQSWRDAIARGAFVPPVGLHFETPIAMPGGVLILAAALRWRRPEARLVVALACVPQTMVIYEAVPLFLIPRTVFESASLMIMSYVAQIVILETGVGTFDIGTSGRWIVWLLYLPAALMVIRRPNEGTATPTVERLVAHWPTWLRGTSVAPG